jgi:hypothetical protein
MGMILGIIWNVICFILKAAVKMLFVLGALALCALKIFIMLLFAVGQIVIMFVRLGASV